MRSTASLVESVEYSDPEVDVGHAVSSTDWLSESTLRVWCDVPGSLHVDLLLVTLARQHEVPRKACACGNDLIGVGVGQRELGRLAGFGSALVGNRRRALVKEEWA